MTTLQLGRLTLGQPSSAVVEPVGDPVGSTGSAVVPAARTPMQVTLELNTILSGASTLLNAQQLRRQLRSLMNNTPLKLQGFLYVIYVDDPEQNGWLIPQPTSFNSPDATAWKGVGLWTLSGANWYLAGRRRMSREARSVWMKSLTTGLYERDQLGMILSTDFAALNTGVAPYQALQISVFPNGASNLLNTVIGQAVPCIAMPTGRDGGICLQYGAVSPLGLPDLTGVSYERAEAALNLSDVIVYDRRGNITGPCPEAKYQNLCLNPSFEYDTTTNAPSLWNALSGPSFAFLQTGSTLTVQTTGGAFSGTKAMRIVTTSSPSGQGATLVLGVLPAGTYTASMYVKGGAGGESLLLTGSLTSGVGATTFGIIASAGFVQYSTTFTTDGVTPAFIGIRNQIASVMTFYVDAVSVTQTSTVQTYFDGDSSGAGWLGVPGISPSQKSPATNLDPQVYFSWQEALGTDWPWNWLTAGQPNDCPVLDNGLVRVRYDASVGNPGFRVDVFNGVGYIEQGKMCIERRGDSTGYCNTFQSAELVEWTPERGVLKCVLTNSADIYSNELVFITVQRGEYTVAFEVYPGLKAAGTVSDAIAVFFPAELLSSNDVNESVMKCDTQTLPPTAGVVGGASTAAFRATAGTGSSFFSAAVLGNSTFGTSENYVSMLRCPQVYNMLAPYQINIVTLQAANSQANVANETGKAYTAQGNEIQLISQNAAGYIQSQLSFTPVTADQVMEAESMTLSSGTVSTSDAAASGGFAATATRTSTAAHVTRATWPNSVSAKYRIFIRVKVSANSASFQATTGTTTGVIVTGVTSTSYVWVDLGEVLSNGTLTINAWMSGGAGTVSVDRIESFLIEDRVRGSAIFSGARDNGQSALYDSRQLGALSVR